MMKLLSLGLFTAAVLAKTAPAGNSSANELKACQEEFKSAKWCCDIKEDYMRASYADCESVKEGEKATWKDTWNTSKDLNLYIKFTGGLMPTQVIPEKNKIELAGQEGQRTKCDTASDKSKRMCMSVF